MNGKKGIILMILSSFSFSCMSVFVKLTSLKVTVPQQMFFRNFISMIIMLPAVFKDKSEQYKQFKNNILAICIRSLLGVLAVYTMFYATSSGTPGIVTAVNRLSPIVVIYLSAWISKERVSRKMIFPVAVSLLGIVLILSDYSLDNYYSIAYAFLSAVFNGCAYTVLGYLKGKVSSKTIVLCFSLFTTLVFASTLVIDHRTFDLKTWIEIMAIGVFAAIGQILVTEAYQVASVSDVAMHENWGTLFSIVLSILFFKDRYTLSMLGGSFLLVIASMLSTQHNQEKC